MIKTTEMTTDDARKLVNQCFIELINEQEDYGGYVTETDNPHLEIEEQKLLAGEHINQLRDETVSLRFSNLVSTKANRLLAASNSSLEKLPKSRQLDILNGVARAMIEQQNLFLWRLEDRLKPFEPVDQLFAADSPKPPFDPATGSTQVALDTGPSVKIAIETYLASKKKLWRPRTHKARVWQLRYLAEFLGPNTILSNVSPDHIREFRNRVTMLRKNHGRSLSQSFAEKQTTNEDAQIKDKTAAIIYEPTKAFFRWAKSEEGLIAVNPAEDINFAISKPIKGVRNRRPFEKPEIEQLFSSPMFTGCKSKYRRFQGGDKVIKDAKFWIPILGYYTGARLGELVQLHVSDIKIDAEIPYLDINEVAPKGSDPKHVKSDAGVRKIPLHPDLFELGLEKFVKTRSKMGKPSKRLFLDVKFGSDGQASTEFSKFFARLMDSVGLTDPALVYHSFRHGTEDALRDAQIPQYVIDRITGHSDGSVSSKYGAGVSLDVAYEAIQKMKLKLPLVEILGVDSST